MTIRGIERVWRGKERDRERKMKVEGYLWVGWAERGGTTLIFVCHHPFVIKALLWVPPADTNPSSHTYTQHKTFKTLQIAAVSIWAIQSL